MTNLKGSVNEKPDFTPVVRTSGRFQHQLEHSPTVSLERLTYALFSLRSKPESAKTNGEGRR
jgi:hypothetical protein